MAKCSSAQMCQSWFSRIFSDGQVCKWTNVQGSYFNRGCGGQMHTCIFAQVVTWPNAQNEPIKLRAMRWRNYCKFWDGEVGTAATVFPIIR